MSQEQTANQAENTKFALVMAIGIIVLIGSVFVSYKYSQKQSSGIVLPGGVTYLGPSQTPAESASTPVPTKARELFTAGPDVKWSSHSGVIYPYSFSYPQTLTLVVFVNDPSDNVAISWGDILPQENILLNMEFIDKRDPKLVSQPKEEYVRNWYKFFPGLKGVAKVEPFVNTNGLKGYKASYINYANASPNTDVFFEIPDQPMMMIHMANGILDPLIFDRILDSVKWTTPKTSF